MSYKPFSTLEKELSRKKGVYNPAGLAAAIARKKVREAAVAAGGCARHVVA